MKIQEQILIEKLDKEETLTVKELIELQQIVDNDDANIFRNKLFNEYSAEDALAGIYFYSRQLTKEQWEEKLKMFTDTEEYEEASYINYLLLKYF